MGNSRCITWTARCVLLLSEMSDHSCILTR
jgi:hypothetical protein